MWILWKLTTERFFRGIENERLVRGKGSVFDCIDSWDNRDVFVSEKEGAMRISV